MTTIDDTGLFVPGSKPRTLRCCFIGGTWQRAIDYPEYLRDYPTLIGRRNIPTRAALADIFQRAEVLVTYDHEHQIIIEASLCGAPIKLVMDDGTLADWPLVK